MTFQPSSSMAFEVQETVTFAKENEQFLKQLTDLYQKIARASNSKDIGIYDEVEVIVGQKYYGANPQTKRDVFRKAFSFGALAPGGTLNIAHGITGIILITRLYGTCITAVVDQRPIPYADVTNVTNQISIRLVGANIVIQNGATAPAITSGNVVIEVLKS